METFHNRLQQAMQQKHMTQSDLCAKTGISRSTMSQFRLFPPEGEQAAAAGEGSRRKGSVAAGL